ncbi:MAG: Wzy polymerase domain-containing protein [Candidatus Nitrotoga sp.]|nr:Wzy polymerase domain-containing protein [Candidatus Nitrotoga sp.]MDO9447219.1 Wzy polymerase domain-containing protein [Candidatus Nitrotoga sp.]MDP3498077.1 Wzy polymerase domain-containing protein [Candidatus Nitrotoga sp.]
MPSIAHISLTFVGLMWVLPFLYYYHAYPLTTFYQEWGAAILGLSAMPLLMTKRYWLQPEIPLIVLLPIGLLLLGMMQFVLGRVSYFDQILLFALYLLWAALLMMLGQRLREEFGLPALATALATFLLVGAELNALAGILQNYRWHTFLDAVVTAKISVAVYGNVAQPNHFANYITLGLISLGLLYMRSLLRAWYVALLTMPLLFVLVLSGSRSVWLYLLFMAGMAWWWQRSDKSCLPLLRYTVLLLLGFGLMHAVVQIPWLEGASGSVTTMRRLFGEGASGSIRLYLWREGWQIFTQFPLLGAGFGQFAWQHFQFGPVLQNTDIVGLYNNAHSLVTHIAAEMGLAGLLILLGTLAMWLIQCSRVQRTVYHWWGYALLGVLAIHSLLEYPLWYAYFLGVAALTLGMLDTTIYRLKLRSVGRLALATILLFGMLSLGQMLQHYRNLEMLMGLRQAVSKEGYSWREDLMAAHAPVPLRPYFDLFMSGKIKVGVDYLADKRILNERVMSFAPIGVVVYREALLLALSGEQAAAQLQMERAIWSYPNDFQAAHRELSVLAQKNPGKFAALLEFALQKYEERQHAVHAR